MFSSDQTDPYFLLLKFFIAFKDKMPESCCFMYMNNL